MVDIAFAFGCFHFGLRKTPPADFTVQQFLQEVEKTLKAVPNIDNVLVSCDPDLYDELLSSPDKAPNLTDGDRPFPSLPDERISFDLLIPFGVQELLQGRYSVPMTFTERFRVEIHYMYRNPVAVFILVSPESEPMPSEAVIIIRRLLEREFQRQQESMIDFQFMGPSPLHADLYLSAKPEDHQSVPWTFGLHVEHTRSYDQYAFFYNTDRFSSTQEALDALLIDLYEELDVYYLATQFEREDLYAWEELQMLSQALVELYQKRGAKGYLARAFGTSHLLDKAFISLAEFEASTLLKDNMLREDYRSTYSSDTTPYLQKFVDERIEESFRYPSEQISKLLQLFETRRLNAVELRVVLVSAISGGIFGALVTALLGNA